jgi:hypothetical protein
VAAAFLSVFTFLRFRPLAKWDDLSNITDLTGFEKINKQSAYMPDKILEQQNISSLLVMGNGCSKWTRQPKKDAEIIDAFIRIRRGNGTIRFMASCPIHLSERDHEPNINKERKNAASLLKLREFKDRSKAAGGKFEIRTYKHVATLRLIILNETECIVGHYQEDGNGDSFDTPLLIFHHNHENKWGFGSAFKRMFESEWHRALEPTEDEWRKMMQLLKDIPE